MSDITIREISPVDRREWNDLWSAYNAFYGRSGATALPETVVETTWERLFDPTEPVHALVAVVGSRLVGFAHYLYHRSTIQIAPTCYLQDLFTMEQARGSGVGRALILAVYDRARLMGSPRVYWQTHETNHVAMKLYDRVAERSGFIVYRRML